LVAALAKFSQQHPPIPNPSPQPIFQIGLELIQLAGLHRPRRVGRNTLRPEQVLPHRLAVITGKFAHGLDAQSLTSQLFDFVHVYPP
jgi:hypothetical protein